MAESDKPPFRLLIALLPLALLTLGNGSRGNDVPPTGNSTASLASASSRLPPLFDTLQERTFHYFWDNADANTGLVPDRYPTVSAASIAAVGFALTAYPIGVERGYITRAEARERVRKTVLFFRDAPQGPAPTGMAGFHGFFYHYLNMRSGQRWGSSELSTVDTAFLLGGMLFCQSYFDRVDPGEVEIRRAIEEIYRRVDWRWVQVHGSAISHGWTPESSFIPYDWRGYNEAMLVYILALGSPSHGVEAAAWNEWTRDYARSWGTLYGQTFLTFAPLFGHQYSHVWVDFRGILDAPMRNAGFDYFENSRRAVYAQRAYAIANPMRWKGYEENAWGLTASDGPTDIELTFGGVKRHFRTYSARGIGLDYSIDDGTIAPTAAASSIAFAPEIVVPAIQEMYRRYGDHIFGKYGFFDAFNLSFDYDVPPQQGRLVSGFGWVDTDYVGIDQGPIVAMIENYRSGLVWRAMRANVHIRTGLLRAGFTGGWLDADRPAAGETYRQ